MSMSWTMFGTSHEVLSPAQLKRLGDHKYCCASCSLLDPIMQKYWNWLVGRLPMGLAPNLITVLGLLVNIITSVIVMLYSPDAKQEAPWWTFVLCAFGLFVYQSLDAIDGKQARRTGTSSALGELFDHGCDSISTVFGAVAMSVAVQLGELPSWMFFQCFAAMTLFYCAHWQTYVSGTLRFGKIDVTEAQFGVMAVHMTSAILGPGIWANRLPVLQLQLKLLPIILCGAAGTVALVSYFRTIFTGGIGKNGSTVAGTSVLSPFIPWSLVVVPAFIIYRKSISGIYENHPCLYILAFGLVSAKVTNRLVVAHMTKSEMDYLDTVLFGPGLLFLNQYFNTAISEYVVLWLCLLWSAIDLLRYSTVVCNQICRYLHIHLFSISPRPPESPSATSATALHPGLPSSRNDADSDHATETDPESFQEDDLSNPDIERQPFLP